MPDLPLSAILADVALVERRIEAGMPVPITLIEDMACHTKALACEIDRLRNAIKEHWSQRADDRCFLDDDRLYAAAGLPPCDRSVGSKEEMLENCKRFIANRCQAGGPWMSYRDLEERCKRWELLCTEYKELAEARGEALDLRRLGDTTQPVT